MTFLKKFSLGLAAILYQEFDYSSVSFEDYRMGGRSQLGSFIGGSYCSFTVAVLADLGSLRLRTTGLTSYDFYSK